MIKKYNKVTKNIFIECNALCVGNRYVLEYAIILLFKIKCILIKINISN